MSAFNFEDEDQERAFKQRLERLHIVLDDLGVPIKGRGKALVDKTGYSQGMISRFLSGKDRLNDRFIKTLCRVYGISEDYIKADIGVMYSDTASIHIASLSDNKLQQKIIDVVVSFFLNTFESKSEPELHRFYADILECNKLQLVKKNGESITIYETPEK